MAKEAVRAVEHYEQAIDESKDVDSTYNLALLMEKVANKVAKDAVGAVELFEQVIEEEKACQCSVQPCIVDRGERGRCTTGSGEGSPDISASYRRGKACEGNEQSRSANAIWCGVCTTIHCASSAII